MTNLETVRQCSAEELAYYLNRYFESCPGGKKWSPACKATTRKCEACWLEWLRKQADEEEWKIEDEGEYDE